MFNTHHRHRRRTDGAPGPERGAGRTRWAAVGAAVAVTLGAGSIGMVNATVDTGERPILVQIEPCRITDTREASTVGPRSTPIGEEETYTITAHGMNGNCDIPAEAVGLSLNVTAVGATAPTNVRIFPEAASIPEASNLNPVPGDGPVPNSVTTQLDGAGTFSVFNRFGTVDLVIDVNGFYEDHNHDDRYVQLGDVLWAVVDGDGTLERSSDGVVSSELLDSAVPLGDYAVVFERDISNCAYQATAGRPGVSVGPQIGFAQVANWTDDPDNGVIVFTRDQNGAGVENRGFHLLVTC